MHKALLRSFVYLLASMSLTVSIGFAQGSFPVRIEDPAGSHCIDASSEEVTIHVRRIFTEKRSNLLWKDKTAGVVVSAKLTAAGSDSPQEVKVPSVNLVDISDDKAGRISLPLEYQIASYLKLKQKDSVTTDVNLSINFAKTRGNSGFADVLTIAGKALDKLPIPANPYTQTASKFLQFANDVIAENTKGQLGIPFANVSLAFRKGPESDKEKSDLKKCESDGKERTGAIAVLLPTGVNGATLIPSTNTDKLYCFRYSSQSTYELLAAPKVGGKCPDSEDQYSGVNNDYVMLLISASPAGTKFGESDEMAESKKRCQNAGLPLSACGAR